jgi:uncharacterized protein
MKPSLALQVHKSEILRMASSLGLSNVRVFGSVARGEDRETSDLDLLVDPTPLETTYFELIEFKKRTEALLGVTVDVCTIGAIHKIFRDRVTGEAIAL